MLNSAELNFDKVVFEYVKCDKKVESAKVELSEENEVAIITFGELLAVGQGKITVVYTGILNDKLKGFYRSKYKVSSGEEKYAAITQFQVHFFFCFIK